MKPHDVFESLHVGGGGGRAGALSAAFVESLAVSERGLGGDDVFGGVGAAVVAEHAVEAVGAAGAAVADFGVVGGGVGAAGVGGGGAAAGAGGADGGGGVDGSVGEHGAERQWTSEARTGAGGDLSVAVAGV